MTDKLKINLRLPFNFKSLTKETKAFNDCILKFKSGKQIPCVRLLLAKNSPKFEEYFEKNSDKGTPIIVEINQIISEKAMEEFVNFLYSNYIQLNVNNIPSLLKIAQYYEFSVIYQLLRRFYLEASNNDETLLHFVSEFIKHDLLPDAIVLAPKIASHLHNIEINDPNEKFTCEMIYKAVTPAVFAAILKEKNKFEKPPLVINDNQRLNLYLYDPNQINIDIKNIQHIEAYVKGLKELTEEDKEELASVVDWENPTAYNYLIKYPCDWLPARFSQPIIESILKKRNLRLKAFKRTIKKQPDEVSRWYALSWIKTVKNGEQPFDDIPIIEFIRTLGGISKPVDPVKYGLLDTQSSQPLIKWNQSKNAFIRDPSLYFISKSENKQPPNISFDLGPNTLFVPKSLYLDSRFLLRTNKRQNSETPYAENKGIVESVEVQTFNNDKSSKPLILQLTDPQTLHGASFSSIPGSKFVFTLSGETSKHSDVFRVSELDVIGNFQLE